MRMKMRTDGKTGNVLSFFLAAAVISIAGALGLPALAADGAGCAGTASAAEIPADWRLILVNADNAVPEGYEVTLLELTNGRKVDERMYPDLQRMFDDARAQGLGLTVREGYRSRQEQEDIMEQRVRQYKEQGMSSREAKKLASEQVAKPGTSEHELGLAVDINAAGETDQWELYNWLAQNSWRYGFILRYPPDKEDITGITYEPWHYRYVGGEAAREIYERQITLEEYLSGDTYQNAA